MHNFYFQAWSSAPFDKKDDTVLLTDRHKHLTKLLKLDREVESRKFQQTKHFPPSPAKAPGTKPSYSAKRATGFLVRAAELGLGTISPGPSKRTFIFKRTHDDDMPDHGKKLMGGADADA